MKIMGNKGSDIRKHIRLNLKKEYKHCTFVSIFTSYRGMN